MEHLASGSIAGLISRAITHPLERLRILQQLNDPVFVNLKTHEAIKKMYRLEGIRGLWKANMVNSCMSAPFSAFEFYFYEFFKNTLFANVTKEQMSLE